MLVGMKAYSIDLRQKILRASDQRLGYQRAIATLCGLSQSFVGKLLRWAAGYLRCERHGARAPSGP